ncbi:hypothetical protein [Mycobacterium sp. DL440]|uniref:hypothetical protein n=1 Tax=Mycobacterium sp. DL440 TaxID=2675523 RepID=UPI001422CB67|nr:hypothetical protein [Mycobacterium sp. DL440]
MSWGDEADAQREYDQDRQALADLLVARGHGEAAVVVAASEFSTEWSHYDSEGLCVRLAVPAALYDQARTEFQDDIDQSCLDIIGEDRYSGLRITVRRSPLRPGLVEDILAALDNRRWVQSERVNEIASMVVDVSTTHNTTVR